MPSAREGAPGEHHPISDPFAWWSAPLKVVLPEAWLAPEDCEMSEKRQAEEIVAKLRRPERRPRQKAERRRATKVNSNIEETI